jgi:hypothetical protein
MAKKAKSPSDRPKYAVIVVPNTPRHRYPGVSLEILNETELRDVYRAAKDVSSACSKEIEKIHRKAALNPRYYIVYEPISQVSVPGKTPKKATPKIRTYYLMVKVRNGARVVSQLREDAGEFFLDEAYRRLREKPTIDAKHRPGKLVAVSDDGR